MYVYDVAHLCMTLRMHVQQVHLTEVCGPLEMSVGQLLIQSARPRSIPGTQTAHRLNSSWCAPLPPQGSGSSAAALPSASLSLTFSPGQCWPPTGIFFITDVALPCATYDKCVAIVYLVLHTCMVPLLRTWL